MDFKTNVFLIAFGLVIGLFFGMAIDYLLSGSTGNFSFVIGVVIGILVMSVNVVVWIPKNRRHS
jgi:hypothetical protein